MKLNIDGTAECGKSYLIQAICQELRRIAKENCQPNPIRVMAPSGVAALNTNGATMHSALGIPATNGSFPPLTGSRLATLQQQWEGVHFVIIDEKSMLGLKMFAKVGSRLRQLIPGSLLEFGGLHLAIIGDFAQLPPVKDRALYCQPPTDNTEASKLAHDGFTLYRGFAESFRLSQIYRQRGDDPEQIQFRELLKRASDDGGLTRSDWTFLLKRYKGNLPPEDQSKFSDVISLHTTAEVVDATNLTQLTALNQPVARIRAKNDGRDAKKAGPEDAGGLENEVLLCKGAKVMVTRNIWQKKGHYTLSPSCLLCYSIVLVTGLVNGTLGTVVDIIWAPDAECHDLPLAVLVECPRYTGPTLWQSSSAYSEEHPHGIPIVPIPVVSSFFDVGGHHCTRTQVPLRLAWAVTVHKSQGLTLRVVKIGLGKREFCSGLTFVALSRSLVTRRSVNTG
jgi:ATP-dependent DNA helicase PIF1